MKKAPDPAFSLDQVRSLSSPGSGDILTWDIQHSSLTAGGSFGFYRIFRISRNWIVLYIDLLENPIPYVMIFRTLERALIRAKRMEKELIFDDIKKKALRMISDQA